MYKAFLSAMPSTARQRYIPKKIKDGLSKVLTKFIGFNHPIAALGWQYVSLWFPLTTGIDRRFRFYDDFICGMMLNGFDKALENIDTVVNVAVHQQHNEVWIFVASY